MDVRNKQNGACSPLGPAPVNNGVQNSAHKIKSSAQEIKSSAQTHKKRAQKVPQISAQKIKSTAHKKNPALKPTKRAHRKAWRWTH